MVKRKLEMTRMKDNLAQNERINRWRRYFKRQRITHIFGFSGGLLLGLCAVPEAYQSIVRGHSGTISALFLGMWGLGEILTLIYVLRSREKLDWPLVLNYTVNLICIAIIITYL